MFAFYAVPATDCGSTRPLRYTQHRPWLLWITLNYFESEGMSSVTSAGLSRDWPSVAWRADADCSTSPSSITPPTRKGLAGLPSTAINAAPPPGAPATTPDSANRLARLACGAACAAVAPSKRATTAGSGGIGTLTASGAGANAGGRASNRSPQYAMLAAASAQTTSVSPRTPHLFCESTIMRRL